MKRTLALAALGLAAMGSAQTTFDEPTNVAFRLGFAYPIDDVTRDIVRNFIGVGMDYFPNFSLLKTGETTFSFDWLGKSGSGAKGNIFPIMVNQRWYQGDTKAGDRRSYFFLGAGIAVIDVVSTGTVLAARGGYGFELGEKIFGEATFIYSGEAGGARATSVGFYLGYRF